VQFLVRSCPLTFVAWPIVRGACDSQRWRVELSPNVNFFLPIARYAFASPSQQCFGDYSCDSAPEDSERVQLPRSNKTPKSEVATGCPFEVTTTALLLSGTFIGAGDVGRRLKSIVVAMRTSPLSAATPLLPMSMLSPPGGSRPDIAAQYIAAGRVGLAGPHTPDAVALARRIGMGRRVFGSHSLTKVSERSAVTASVSSPLSRETSTPAQLPGSAAPCARGPGAGRLSDLLVQDHADPKLFPSHSSALGAFPHCA
jgi:hypothetical protein